MERHLNGLRFRGGLLRAALFKRTNDAVEDVRTRLEAIGLNYDGVAGNLDPFTLLARLPSPVSFQRLDFSRCDRHTFVRPDDSLPGEWSSEKEVAAFIGQLICAKQAQTVVEVGCFVGRTSSYLATALRESARNGKLHCIDVNPLFLQIARRNIEELGLADLVRWVPGRSTDPLVLEQIPNEIDILYIDSYHDYENSVKELACYGPKLSASGWIVFHDSVRWPGVRRAVCEAARHWDVFNMATSQGNGLAVLTER